MLFLLSLVVCCLLLRLLLFLLMSIAMAATDTKVHRLGFGQSPFPVPSHVRQMLQQHAYQKDYVAVRGLSQLREAIARFLVRAYGHFPERTESGVASRVPATV